MAAGATIGTVATTPALTQNYTMKLAIAVANDPLHEFIREYKKVVEDSGRDVESHMYTFSVDAHKKAEKLWRDNGAEVIYLSDSDRKEFMRRVVKVGDEILAADPKVKPLYDILKATAAKNRGT